jgi:hypothetical protein
MIATTLGQPVDWNTPAMICSTWQQPQCQAHLSQSQAQGLTSFNTSQGFMLVLADAAMLLNQQQTAWQNK